jgi:glycerol-3-phosphate dehydrogenase (NAD(P)+)
MKKIAVYGIGTFGFAIVKHLNEGADAGRFSLHTYDIDKTIRDSLRLRKKHPIHHKNIKVSDSVIIDNSPKELLTKADIIILAVASNAIRKVLEEIKRYCDKKIIILNTAKALDAETGERFSVIINDALKSFKHPVSVAVLAGGTIARDLFFKEPLGVDIAGKDKKTLEILKKIFVSDNLNVYTTTDIAGVEYASAFKNVVSISAGIMKGLNFSYGSETHIISRLSGEIKKLVVSKLGGKAASFSTESQCWGNDMLMSATGGTRNREFGILLGKGFGFKKALARMKKQNKTVEGINTVKVIKKIMNNNNFHSPLLFLMSEIVLKNKNPKEGILALMASNKI